VTCIGNAKINVKEITNLSDDDISLLSNLSDDDVSLLRNLTGK